MVQIGFLLGEVVALLMQIQVMDGQVSIARRVRVGAMVLELLLSRGLELVLGGVLVELMVLL